MSAPDAGRLPAAQRRQIIVKAAQPLFAAKGLDGVTTRDVANAAGVSEALLYRHFDSKAALYDEVLISCARGIAGNAALIEGLPDSTETLVRAVHLMMRNIQLATLPGGTDQDTARLALRSLLEDGAFARGLVRAGATHVVAKIESCVRAGIAAGDIEEPLEHAVAGFWFGHHLATSLVFFSLPVESVVPYPVSNRETLFEISVRHVLRGLGLTRAAIERHYQPHAFSESTPHDRNAIDRSRIRSGRRKKGARK